MEDPAVLVQRNKNGRVRSLFLGHRLFFLIIFCTNIILFNIKILTDYQIRVGLVTTTCAAGQGKKNGELGCGQAGAQLLGTPSTWTPNGAAVP